MKSMLLFAVLLSTAFMSAQETHIINWSMAGSPEQFSLTIPQGDIVTWVWTDDMPHTVTSAEGFSTETFDSGELIGPGQNFSHTFTLIGENPYNCVIHPWMQGSISVESGTAGKQEITAQKFSFYPNPVTDILNINGTEIINRLEIYDSTGKLVTQAGTTTPTINVHMDGYHAGTYFIKAISGSNIQNITVIKQ
jgi:plastocyanin